MVLAELKGVNKIYQVGDQEIVALQKTDLKVNLGELMLIIGPSGSGKTTLLSMLGCVIYPTEGSMSLDGKEITRLSENKLAEIRLNTIGFVFQSFNLIAPLTAEDNVLIPLQLQGVAAKEAKQRAADALKLVGMTDRAKNLPRQLSGGQQQRVAIARALVTNPKMILCDEPTASLDKDSLVIVMKELRHLAETGKAVAVVTHDPRLKEYAHRIIEVNNGFVTESSLTSLDSLH
jgi:putative ABC transport system ATP-binding protein